MSPDDSTEKLLAAAFPAEPRASLPKLHDAWAACHRPAPFAPHIEALAGARFHPQRSSRFLPNPRMHVVDGGVFDASGEPCLMALSSAVGTTQFPRGEPGEAPVLELPGTSLFGGYLHMHFGQFLLHSLGRLWAVHQAGERIDRIVFGHLLGHRKATDRIVRLLQAEGVGALPFARDLLPLVAGPIPVELLHVSARFERLLVPQQLNSRHVLKGHPGFREFCERFGSVVDAIPPDADGQKTDLPQYDDVYISRSKVKLPSARFVLEEMLEENLQRSGYYVFHPQKFPMRTQLRILRRARRIVAAEGSALHLLAMVARSEQQIAVIQRRPRLNRFAQQLRASGVRRCTQVDAIIGRIAAVASASDTRRLSDPVTPAVLDFGAVRDALAQAGLVDPAGWSLPGDGEVLQAVARLAEAWPTRRGEPPWRFEILRQGAGASDPP